MEEEKKKEKEKRENKKIGKERKGRRGEREEDRLLSLNFFDVRRTKEKPLFMLQEIVVFSFLGYYLLRAI